MSNLYVVSWADKKFDQPVIRVATPDTFTTPDEAVEWALRRHSIPLGTKVFVYKTYQDDGRLTYAAQYRVSEMPPTKPILYMHKEY